MKIFSENQSKLKGNLGFNTSLSSIYGALISYPDIAHSLFGEKTLNKDVDATYLRLFSSGVRNQILLDL